MSKQVDLTKLSKGELKKFLIKEIKDLLNNLGDGDISPSAYDTAWVARIPSKDDPSKPMFPQCLQWVKDNQLEDGSWGAKDIEYYHDRIICTLSCIIALKIWGEDEGMIERGVRYVNENTSNLCNDAFETIGFEVLFPSLFNECVDLQIQIYVEGKLLEDYRQDYNTKLEKIPLGILGKKHTTISHSLEFLGSTLRNYDISKQVGENGSIGNSPSASAAVLMAEGKGLEYITSILKKYGNYVPTLYPLEVFERVWVLDHVVNTDLTHSLQEWVIPHVSYLDKLWSETGLSMSKYFPTSDIDDTCVGYSILKGYGIEKPLSVFEAYEFDSGFFCYPGEMNGSISHLSNLVKTLYNEQDSELGAHLYDKAFKQLSSLITSSNLFKDKWNISKYYILSRLPKALIHTRKDIRDIATELVFSSQNKDGSWGMENSSIEETSYVVSFLLNSFPVNRDLKKILHSAFTFLLRNYWKEQSNTWIGKVLYTPYNIRNMAILTSLYKLCQIIK